MGILDWLLGRKSEANTTIVTPRHPTAPPNSGTAAVPTESGGRLKMVQGEFLDTLSRRELTPEFSAQWAPHVGNAERQVRALLQAGLLEEANLADKLDRRHTAVELKDQLRIRGAKVSGKKAEVAARLAELLTPAEAAALVGTCAAYRLTPAGTQQVAAHRALKEQLREQMEQDAVSLLVRGDIRGAGKRIAHFETQQVWQRGMGIDWSGGMTSRSLLIADWLMRYPHQALPYPEAVRRAVAAEIALLEMLGKSSREAAKRILPHTGGTFSCPAVEQFLRDAPCGGFAESHDPDCPSDVAQLYAHSIHFQALNCVDLDQLLGERFGKGVEIQVAGQEHCRICSKGKRKFRWSEIDQLPQLPRHWGCRCSYGTWMDAREFHRIRREILGDA